MTEKGIFKIVGIIALSLVLIFVTTGYFGNKKTQIEADRTEAVRHIEAERAEVVRAIEREEKAIVQAQKTERTEERSQFWQSLVPWGTDEAEDNNTEIPTTDQPLETK